MWLTDLTAHSSGIASLIFFSPVLFPNSRNYIFQDPFPNAFQMGLANAGTRTTSLPCIPPLASLPSFPPSLLPSLFPLLSFPSSLLSSLYLSVSISLPPSFLLLLFLNVYSCFAVCIFMHKVHAIPLEVPSRHRTSWD